MFTELTIPQYVEKMAGISFPSPKGGSALAITGAMGAALAEMCSRVSANNYPGESRYQDISEIAVLLQERFLQLADKDTEVVYEMILANRKKGENHQEREAIKVSNAKANENLFRISEVANDLLDLVQYLEPLCVPSCIVDLQIVLALATTIKDSVAKAIGDGKATPFV
ncbi:MAG: cyclodeaminase/cyclohydrolase family protein [Bacillota bacterium]